MPRPPKDVIGELPPNVIFKVIKPLYGIPEAGTHLVRDIPPSITERKLGWELQRTVHVFSSPRMEMDRSGSSVCKMTIHSFSRQRFVKQEDVELKRAELLAKPSEQLTGDNPLLFNGCKLMMEK